MLTLPIKRKWLDMIVSGEKLEEYRDIKPFYNSRFKNLMPNIIFNVKFRNGYSGASPFAICSCDVHIGVGKSEWGASPTKQYYVLRIIYRESEVKINDTSTKTI